MSESIILRKLFLGFVQIQILKYAKKEPIYGSWLMRELHNQHYEISAGTLYPILHSLETNGLLQSYHKTMKGKIRRYYSITVEGERILWDAKNKIIELSKTL